jgi:hypothetical protein
LKQLILCAPQITLQPKQLNISLRVHNTGASGERARRLACGPRFILVPSIFVHGLSSHLPALFGHLCCASAGLKRHIIQRQSCKWLAGKRFK